MYMKRLLLFALLLVILVSLIAGYTVIPREYTVVREHIPRTNATELLPEAVVRPEPESRSTAQ